MPVISQRIKYQQMFAEGKIVNIGCGEDPAGFGEHAVHVDLDVYNHPNFVQADAHNLPFKDDEFDTAILGDILEHAEDPVKMLSEAGRVAKKVVATVYEEWRLRGDKEAQIQKFYSDEKKLGFDNHIDYLRSLPDFKDKIVEVIDDHVVSHHPHLHMFTEDGLKEIIDKAGLEVIIFKKYQEGEAEGRAVYNWLIVVQKKA